MTSPRGVKVVLAFEPVGPMASAGFVTHRKTTTTTNLTIDELKEALDPEARQNNLKYAVRRFARLWDIINGCPNNQHELAVMFKRTLDRFKPPHGSGFDKLSHVRLVLYVLEDYYLSAERLQDKHSSLEWITWVHGLVAELKASALLD